MKDFFGSSLALGLALILAGCMSPNPPPSAGSGAQDQQSAYPWQGWVRGYESGPVTNYNPYSLPEYHGGYTPN